MKKVFCIIAALFVICSPATAQTKEEEKIRWLMEQQRMAWNTGDLEKFMDSYWQNDSLMFIGKSGVTYGWQSTLDNYKKGYPDRAAMGILDFDLLEVKRLSVMYYYVVGKWHLTRTIGNVSGYFTLLFRKVKNRWVIVADHSS